MDRSKRAIRTPKRFDDGGFIMPSSKPKNTPTASAAAAGATSSHESASPNPTPTKSIIKIKLASKAKPRIAQDKLVKDEQPSTPLTPVATPTPPPSAPTESQSSIKVEPMEVDAAISQAASTTTSASTTPATVSTKASSHPNTASGSKGPGRHSGPKSSTPKTTAPRSSVTKSSKSSHANANKDNLNINSGPPPAVLGSASSTKMKRPKSPPQIYHDIVVPNVILPFWDARTAAEEHEDDNVKELVHCHCEVEEEMGLMIQCETCLTWQHAHCMRFAAPEDVPDGYTCNACSDPKFVRESMKWAYDQEWLTKGRLKRFKSDFDRNPNLESIERNVKMMARINDLIGNVLNIDKIVHGLKVKKRILANAEDDDQELKVFNFQWPASYQHSDGSHFIPTINQVAQSPASTISVMDEAPDLGDVAALPEIAQLDDVSAILDAPYVSQNNTEQPMMTSDTDITAPVNDCRTNLKLHIQQTEEFINIELSQVENQIQALLKEMRECAKSKSTPATNSSDIDLAKNDTKVDVNVNGNGHANLTYYDVKPNPNPDSNANTIPNSPATGTTNANGASNSHNSSQKEIVISLSSLKNDLRTMKKYIMQSQRCR